jgi:pimeloyl-ACP methyl ester carboxylesterase
LCGELLRAWSSSLKRETAEAYVVVATFPDAPEQGCLAASLAGMGRRAANMSELVALMTFGQLAKDSKSNGPSGSLLQRRMVMAQRIKNVVLVHGAFADGSGWEPVANILMNDGYKVSVAQPPETSYADDVKYTKAAIDAMDGPVVLVGHSYGGSIITEAGNHPKVVALVYIAAFALDEGESCASIEQAVPQASKAFKPDSNGNWWIEQEHFAADFAADIPKEKAAFMAISQVPISTDSFTHKVTTPAWRHKPTWYMVATEDRSINPAQERMMAKRAKAKTVEVEASHVAYISYPKETVKLIEEAATAAHVNG